MDDLKERQKQVLQIIVSTYVKTVNPVGSRAIAEHYHNELSPATIRNEMHDLEERAYIAQPHTSAGRVPTDKGYRYYVDHLMSEPKVAPHVAALVAREYREQIDNIETLIERTSKIISTLSEQASLVVFPTFEELILKRIELASLGRQHLLVVWVTDSGLVQDQVMNMKEDIPAEELARISRFLNLELTGMLLAQVQPYLIEKFQHAQDSLRTLYQMAHAIVSESFPKTKQKRMAVEGSRYILEQPEFQDWEKSRRLFIMLETKDVLSDLVCGNSDCSGVRVQIGFEHQCADIWDCSVVTAQYRVHQRTVGTLGVLGPRRMQYERVVSLVDYVSRRFGEALEQWL
ncbi:MAG: heat-inducible transcription repressor HrcA [Candidatus Omnitrophica bacterium]|nr:heat-inducible transcription repressor HrcA [Candidatus Omnitrophota bacterium]